MFYHLFSSAGVPGLVKISHLFAVVGSPLGRSLCAWVPPIRRDLGCGGALLSALIRCLLCVPASLSATVSHKTHDWC